MSHPQAFHTSCRTGLSGHAGFQFNAASRDLDERQLARLAAAHAGYRAAPDTPMEPDPAQIARLPVSLRYLPVEGMGPVVSHTAYVGREFRGRDGEPDSGRFGNYFSHIVVDGGAGVAPFCGLMPIELWGAPHWSTTESETTELPRLERLEPGPVDLEGVLAQLLPSRAPALGPVLDACFRALLGGPRVVLVEPDPALSAAWIAWASFALPADRVPQLTFSTFDGRPRVAEAVRVCVTTPACDVDFPAYELGSAVAIVDATAPAGADLCLYARVAASLAAEGAEAVAAAVRELDPGLDLEPAGAALAVLGRRTDLVTPGEAAGVLAVLRDGLPRFSAETAAALAAALPDEVGSPDALAGWSRLHAAARDGGDPEETGLVDLSLGRVLGAFRRADEIEPVRPGARVAPSVSALAGWSSLVSAAPEPERLGEVIEAGVRLRLVGRNSALDRELAGTIADGFGDEAVRRAYDALAAEGNEPVVEGVALELAERAGSGGPVAPLRHVARHPAAGRAVRAKAEEDQSFEMTAAWEVLRVEADHSHRPAAVARLAELATTERQAELIRDLYGEGGPSDPAEHAELLKGWSAAGRSAPLEDCQRALASLATLPLRREPASESLLRPLDKGPSSIKESGEYMAWLLLFQSPPRLAFADWTWTAHRVRRPLSELPRSRAEEVRALAAEVAAASLGEDRYDEGLDDLADMFGARWLEELGEALGRALGRAPDPEALLARAFVEWRRSPHHARDLTEEALPRATRDLSPRQLEAVGERLGKAQAEAWNEWLEEHPPSGAVSRAVRGVFRRGEGKR